MEIRTIKLPLLSFALFSLLLSVSNSLARGDSIPYLKDVGGRQQLIVDDEPMLLISGELRNSASSSLPYVRQSLDRCQELGLNSVIATISWEQFEPVEGTYDYSLVDGLIHETEKQSLKLVLIWFDTYKNGKSSYVPEWVKRDTARFPRTLSSETEPGQRLELPEVVERYKGQKKYKVTLSPVFEETWNADARAFVALMSRIKKVDKKHTVVMNEAGLQDVAIDQQSESRS